MSQFFYRNKISEIVYGKFNYATLTFKIENKFWTKKEFYILTIK
jgi:hypothetical protein